MPFRWRRGRTLCATKCWKYETARQAMPDEHLPEAAEAGHLTEILRRSGVLGAARVCAVTVQSSRPTILSRIMRLGLTYEGAAAEAPRSIILKTGLPERSDKTWNSGRQEVAFYTNVAALMPAGLVPRHFE